MPMPISRRTFALGLAAGAATTVLPSPAVAAQGAAEPFFAESTLWDSTVDPLASYHVYGLATLPDDTILACTEGRHEVCDAGPHDLLLRRSTDKGQTWSPSQAVVPSVNGQSYANPTFVVDRTTGEVFLFFGLCVRLPENTSCSSDSSTMYVISSKDGGLTWGARRELTGLFAHFPYNWAMHGPGPGHGIQLDSGRLLLSVAHRTIITGVPAAERHYGASTVYSDDHGATWKSGGEVPMGAGLPVVGEARLVQRADGRVVMNSRPGSGGDWPRDVAVSQDGGLSWSLPTMEFSAGLFNGVDTGFLRYTGGQDVNRVLFSRPDAPMRWNMTVSVSYDEGESLRYSRTVHPGRSYYSDLARLSDGTIILLYGCDGDLDGSPRRVAAARFNLEWLTTGRDSLATGPNLTTQTYDLGRPAARAAGSGGTATVLRDATARDDARLAFAPAAVGDFVEYPFVVTRDGEHELWVRHYRSPDGGLVTVTVDGKKLRTSTVDLTSFRSAGYDVVLLGRAALTAGRHTVRFTLAGAGRGGGTAISLDRLTLVQAFAKPDVREEVTVDNGGLGFAVTGTWASGRSIPGYYGFNYVTHARGTGANTARWRPALPGDDRYEVLVSYTADPNRATNAVYVVHHASGTTSKTVNQEKRGVPDARTGEWTSLGTFTFRAGTAGYVELSDAANGYVIADAVRFRRQASS
ncbi:BNR repeat-like domain-containing protein [Nonomuraea solani]|uniref:exo-alpha-sialidase n=1 Tax=Nonomuraea solani TaxID=1144553 RepID=A0A1H6ERC8_9ACTN|nr:exo-alpha-sialidase [Nonomuraea solani]SEG99973.1 BNR repeat-like domain-containing protein [Nonomuraea solani]